MSYLEPIENEDVDLKKKFVTGSSSEKISDQMMVDQIIPSQAISGQTSPKRVVETRPELETRVAPKNETAEMGKGRVKILLIDDDVLTRQTYAEVFRQNNFEVIEAANGAEGLKIAAESIPVPNVIFTGIDMPQMGGFELMQALKKNVATSDIPVAISSHMGRPEDQQKAKELGAKDFIARDTNTPKEVVQRIMAVLNLIGYKLKFYTEEMDAPKLEKELFFSRGFVCSECGTPAVIALTLQNKDNKHEFRARLICPNCGKEQ